jgi:L-cysteine:1D-myo-inositol 2-amino-2-deoxy-alpha-D-glucopyranoside ligase
VEGSAPALNLYDSATRSVRPTAPGPVATMYVCGITPYDATHIGHAATYLAFDLVHRYWLAAGHQVRYVQNVTDIDDPLLERAERDGIDWRDLAERPTDLFRSDMTALRVIPPEQYIGAVEAMDEISAAVAELMAAGAGYRVADEQYPDVYFDITTTGRFGEESGYDEATMLQLSAERGGDPDRPGKRHRLDPLLWRMARAGEPSWPSPLGDGRPGWHIECSVIATNRLGARIDLQGGGSDLIFPHHECSAAHAEALSGEHPFAEHYVHTGMMMLDGEKMSKSLGNLAFVSKLVAGGADPMAIRAALLDGHYRVDRPWSDDLLAQATERVTVWREAALRAGEPADKTVTTIREALADDLDSPRALRALDAWAADGSLGGDEVAVAADALLGLALRD